MPKTRVKTRKKHQPFYALANHKKRDHVIELKNNIKRDTQLFGGMFTSHLGLDEPDRPDLYDQWFSCLFLGRDRHTIWNASIR